MFGFDIDKKRPNKYKTQKQLFDSLDKDKIKKCLLFPSVTQSDLRYGYFIGLFDKDTRFWLIDDLSYKSHYCSKKEKKNQFLRGLFEFERESDFQVKNCNLFFDKVQNLTLKEAIDFAYFDFCGMPSETLMRWFVENKGCFQNGVLMFTYDLDGIARNYFRKGKEIQYGYFERYGINGKIENNILNNCTQFLDRKSKTDIYKYDAKMVVDIHEYIFEKRMEKLIIYRDFHGHKMCSFILKNEMDKLEYLQKFRAFSCQF